MDNSFVNLVNQARSVLILLPTRPFFDQVAGALSLYLSFRQQKSVDIACPGDMIVEFNRLVGINKIGKELGSKNLVISFSDYKATDIERVSYDIENREFKLTVVPKQEVRPPQQSQVDLSYAGVGADLVILVGGIKESHFPALNSKSLAGAKIIHIGTKNLQVSKDLEITSFTKPPSSASEIVYRLLKEGGHEIDPDVATNLIMGIQKASSNFTNESVSANTFQVAADLMRLGGKRKPLRNSPSSFPPGSIPGQDQAEMQNEKEKHDEEPPKEWLGPKIYKGSEGD